MVEVNSSQVSRGKSLVSPTIDGSRIAVLGLGYVGLPLAVAFGAILPTLGFDIDGARVEDIRAGRDRTGETSAEKLGASTHLSVSSDVNDIRHCNVFVVTVPTPIDSAKQPDLGPLRDASQMIGRVIRRGGVAIFESTVYPGATEEVCVPIIEAESGLVYNRDFFAGYSPERINPGDNRRKLENIVKVTSGSTPAVAEFVDGLYGQIVLAGTHRAPSIRVAEAAKVIENTQRDLNIALVNELSLIFHRLGIDTGDVLAAAETKWNFLPFKPGLVGGHCIGVDPSYLTYKAEQVGYHPAVILSGRRVNDAMGEHVAERVVKLMIARRTQVADSKVLVLGLAFKEDCPDLRNTRVVDVVTALRGYHAQVDVYDPLVDGASASSLLGFELIDELVNGTYDAVVLAVAHSEFIALGAEGLRALGKHGMVLFDVKQVLARESVDDRL